MNSSASWALEILEDSKNSSYYMLKTRKLVSASWAAGSYLWSGGSANSCFRYELMIQKSYVHARNLTRR